MWCANSVWHKEAEWAYILQGHVRFTVVDADRNVFIDDLKPGDVWLVPAGIPHSIQGLQDGCEFLLNVTTAISRKTRRCLLPSSWRICRRASSPRISGWRRSTSLTFRNRKSISSACPYLTRSTSCVGSFLRARRRSPSPGMHRNTQRRNMTAARPRSSTRPNSPETSMSALIIELEPSAMRELHWHPDADEWQYYLEGEARMTVFDATSKARTFNFSDGDVGYVPRTMGHYIENIGTTSMRCLNVFNKPKYKDVSLNNWMALTPPDLVRGHLDLDDPVMNALRRDRRPVVR